MIALAVAAALVWTRDARAAAPEIEYRVHAKAGARALTVEVFDPPGKVPSARYKVTSRSPAGKVFPPVVEGDYFHVTGRSLFRDQERDGETPLRVTVVWDLPEGWAVANSFGAGERVQRFVEPPDRYKHAVYMGGAIRAAARTVRGRPVWTAIRGEWPFSDEEFRSRAARVVEMERAFWADDDFPFFLVTLQPMRGVVRGHHGSAFTQSFAVEAGTATPLSDFEGLMAHEAFHVLSRIRIERGDREELQYWFSEGFTNYYARLLLLRAGMTTPADYVKDYNEALRDYYSSPEREAPNERIRTAFWKSDDVEHLPYLRGDVVAHNWSARIRRAAPGRSLDDVMRDLRAESRGGAIAPFDGIGAALRKYLPDGGADELARLKSGAMIAPEPDSLGSCARLVKVSPGVYDPGFDFERSKADRIVRGVVPGGAAEEAGLRDGQRLGGWSMYGDPDRPNKLTVVEGKSRRELTYLPRKRYAAGKEPAPIPQFELAGDPAACRL